MINYGKHSLLFTAIGKDEFRDLFPITYREFNNENIFV